MTKSGQICATLFTHHQSCFRCITSKIIRQHMHTQFRFSDMHVHTNPFFTHPVQISSPCMCMFVHVELVRVKYPLSMHVHINSSTKCTLGYACHNTSPNSERTNIGYTPMAYLLNMHMHNRRYAHACACYAHACFTWNS